MICEFTFPHNRRRGITANSRNIPANSETQNTKKKIRSWMYAVCMPFHSVIFPARIALFRCNCTISFVIREGRDWLCPCSAIKLTRILSRTHAAHTSHKGHVDRCRHDDRRIFAYPSSVFGACFCFIHLYHSYICLQTGFVRNET